MRTTDKYPDIYDQGALGSCTANMAVFMAQYTELEESLAGARPSRLFHYYNTRVIQKTVKQDSGASIRNALKAFSSGYCPEATWPYRVKDFAVTPAKSCYTEAARHKLTDAMYMRVEKASTAICQALAANDPVGIGFSVYESFMHIGKDGVMPTPAKSESMVGGHAVTFVGYNLSMKRFIVRNSWGPKWGDQGHFYVGFDLVDLPGMWADAWVVRSVPKW